jgi:hypothetical protein
MGQGGQGDRLAEADAAARVGGLTPQMGGRAHVLVAGPEQEDEQGLREVVCNERSLCLRSDDASYGKAVGPCIGFFKQFLRGARIPRTDGAGDVPDYL